MLATSLCRNANSAIIILNVGAMSKGPLIFIKELSKSYFVVYVFGFPIDPSNVTLDPSPG